MIDYHAPVLDWSCALSTFLFNKIPITKCVTENNEIQNIFMWYSSPTLHSSNQHLDMMEQDSNRPYFKSNSCLFENDLLKNKTRKTRLKKHQYQRSKTRFSLILAWVSGPRVLSLVRVFEQGLWKRKTFCIPSTQSSSCPPVPPKTEIIATATRTDDAY